MLVYLITPQADARTHRRMDVLIAEDRVISIVDDDESVRVATASLVRSLGFKAYTFSSGEEFLASPPHIIETSCVIADVRMPTMSGLELQNRLIADGRQIPIIFITAFPDQRLKTRVMKAGAIALLSKPFRGETLINCINKALGRRGDT